MAYNPYYTPYGDQIKMDIKEKQKFIDELYDKELITMTARVKIYKYMILQQNEENFNKLLNSIPPKFRTITRGG